MDSLVEAILEQGFFISPQVYTTWGLMAFMVGLGWLAGRSQEMSPGRMQSTMEGIVLAFYGAVEVVLPGRSREFGPLVATLWLFIGFCNLLGLFPHLHAPTGHLSVTAALAVLVFFSVHYYGIKHAGLKAHLKHYFTPSPILFPFHVLGEFTRTLALAVRLFGNIMSLEMAAAMVMMVAAFLAPVPVLALHIIEAIVQAYIFGVLSLIYIAGAVQAHEAKKETHSQETPEEPSQAKE